MKSIAAGLVLAVLAGGLVGCGQKGPLFLPGDNPNPPKPLLHGSQAAPGPGEKPGADHAMGTSTRRDSENADNLDAAGDTSAATTSP